MPRSPHRGRCARRAAAVALVALQPLLAAGSAVGAADTAAAIVGEWAPSPADCADNRTVFEAGGTSRALVREGGDWRTMAEGRYSVDGDTMTETITAVAEGMPAELVGTTGRTEIAEIGADSVTFVPQEPERRELIGGSATLVRCPPRG